MCCLTTDMDSIWKLAKDRAITDRTILEEITVSRSLDVRSLTSQDFLKELAWAIYGAGFNVNTLRMKFPALQEAFEDWDPDQISKRADANVQDALAIIRHTGKANAVKENAIILHSRGWDDVRNEIFNLVEWDGQERPVCTQGLIDFLDEFHWVGPTLARFVAKNIGIESIKDDVMIKRLALHLGYSDDFPAIMEMAKAFQAISGESVSVIDTILWSWVREQSCL